MTVSKAELSEALIFRPGPIGDPPPWMLQILTKEQIIQVATIQIELQRATLAASSKALEQFAAIVKSAR